MLEDALNAEVLKHLTNESKQCLVDVLVILVYDPSKVESQIDTAIERTVAGLVDAELDNYIPRALREKVDTQRLDIQKLHVQIHNTLSTQCTHSQSRLTDGGLSQRSTPI